jgi:hypothetical protein
MAKQFCTQCGQQMQSEDRFCMYCGAEAIPPEVSTGCSSSGTTTLPGAEDIAPPVSQVSGSEKDRVSSRGDQEA